MDNIQPKSIYWFLEGQAFLGTHLKTKAGKQVIVRVDGLKPNLPMNVFLQNFYSARLKILSSLKKQLRFRILNFLRTFFKDRYLD